MAYLPNRGRDFPRGVASYVSPIVPRKGLGDNPLIDGMRTTDGVVSRTAVPDYSIVSPIDISSRKNSVGSRTFLSIGKGNVRPYTDYKGQPWSSNPSGLSGFFEDISNAFGGGGPSIQTGASGMPSQGPSAQSLVNMIGGSGQGGATAGSVAQGAITGATIGSAVPIIGTAIGAAVGAAVAFFGGSFGAKETTGMPQKPVPRDFAAALANKWVTYYADAPQDAGKWTNEIAADGPERAWVNFATPYKNAPRSKNGVTASTLAVQLFGQIGSPYEVNKGQGFQGQTSSTQPPAGYGTTFNPYGATVPTQTPYQAGIGSMSTGTMLILAAGVLGAVVMMNRKPTRS